MKYLSISIMFLLLCATLQAEQNEELKESIKKSSSTFWTHMVAKKFDKAEEFIFKQKDDASFPDSEFMEKAVGHEFKRLKKYVSKLPKKGDASKKDIQKIEITKLDKMEDRVFAKVTIWAWEPKEKEYEKLTVAWLKTKSGSLKLVDL